MNDQTNDLYQEIILEEYKHPQNVGVLENPTHTLRGRNSSCGDEVVIQLKTDSAEIIQEVAWQGQGCAISIASTSLLSQQLKGKTLLQVFEMNRENMLDLLGLEEFSIGREKCLMLGLQTLKNAKLEKQKGSS